MSVTAVCPQADAEQHLGPIAGGLHRSKGWVINQALSECIEKQHRAQERWQNTPGVFLVRAEGLRFLAAPRSPQERSLPGSREQLQGGA